MGADDNETALHVSKEYSPAIFLNINLFVYLILSRFLIIW